MLNKIKKLVSIVIAVAMIIGTNITPLTILASAEETPLTEEEALPELEKDLLDLEENQQDLEEDLLDLEEDSQNLEEDALDLEEDVSDLEEDQQDLEEDLLDLEKTLFNLSNVRIVIDPGHGGRDPGTVVTYFDGTQVRESDIVLEVSLRLRELFRQIGMGNNVSMTRETDVFIELEDRVHFANQQNADIFVSIHTNSATNTAANGIETFFWGPVFSDVPNTRGAQGQRLQDSELLARKIQNRLLERLQLANRGVRRNNFLVINQDESNVNRPWHDRAAAVLPELGFLSNDTDRAVLMTDEGMTLAAEAIYLGILDYFQEQGHNVPQHFFDQIGAPVHPQVAPAPSVIAQGETTVDGLNVRLGNSTAHASIGTLPMGTTVNILAKHGGWYRIQSTNMAGWISGDFVNIISTPELQDPCIHFGRTTGNVNMRSGAGTAHGIIRNIPRGTHVTVLGESNGWFNIRVGSEEGWISGQFLASMNLPGRIIANVNMRTGAGASNPLIRNIPRGTHVAVLGESNGWFKVRVGSEEGWISGRFLSQQNTLGRTTASVNMRTGAGASNALIRNIPRGTNVTVLGESNGWFNIRVGSEEGWVSGQFLTQMNLSGQTTANVNMRTGAGASNPLIRNIPRGTSVIVLGENNGWFNIRVGNEEGWISGQFLNKTATLGQTTANVNMRTGAGASNALIRNISRGTLVNVLGESNGWFNIRVGSEEGWVSGQFLSQTNLFGQTTGRVNMRSGAGTSHNIIRNLPRGTNVTILGATTNWIRVRVGNQEGWISAQFLG